MRNGLKPSTSFTLDQSTGGSPSKTRILAGSTVDYMTSNHLEPGMQNYIELADPTKAGFEFGLSMAVRTSAGGPAFARDRRHRRCGARSGRC